jgi:hypothetical protein
MCGCASKNTATQVTATSTTNVHVFSDNGECPYTIEQVNSWLVTVQCVKNNGYYINFGKTEYDINLYIGVLLSTQNYQKNGGSVCYYQNELAEIESFVITVKNASLCLS